MNIHIRNSAATVLFLISPVLLTAQELSNLRQRYIVLLADTVVVDSLPVVPGSLRVLAGRDTGVDTSLYRISYGRSQLVMDTERIRKQYGADSLMIRYRVLARPLAKIFRHKDATLVQPGAGAETNPFSYKAGMRKEEDLFGLAGLEKSGSISRGVSFGNSQDVSVSSSLNLQLSGPVSDKITLTAALSDDNIPVQPDGNTAQLQDFDKVFVRLNSARSELMAGDYQLSPGESYFMKFFKRNQGGTFTTTTGAGSGELRFTGSAAVSKGKYARHAFPGIEGNQGPYRLKGNENESFIIVLAGTEQVFIDGELLQRGQENDYVIDYNTAEVVFTARRPVTKDSRIAVEFQYSDKNYVRSLLYSGTQYSTQRLKLRLQVYSEQDSRNQPLQQELDDEQKMLLRSVGDSLHLAVYTSADSVGFSDSEVRYRKTDTLGYPGVYVYSTDPSSAVYRIGFSNVGQNKGNYVQVQSNANGRVFEWRKPVAGVPQGTHEPVVTLAAPKKRQMATAGVAYTLSETSELSVETAVSNNDVNLFAPHDKAADDGYAVRMLFHTRKPLGERWALNSAVDYEMQDRNFTPIERFRSVEFGRDWNVGFLPPVRRTPDSFGESDQHIGGLSATLSGKSTASAGYEFRTMQQGAAYSGYRNRLNGKIDHPAWLVEADASLLVTSGTAVQTDFLRHKAALVKKWKHLHVGLKEEQENNRFADASGDTLLGSSYLWTEWQAFLSNGDSSVNRFSLYYKQRTDDLPSGETLTRASTGESVGLSAGLLGNPGNIVRLHAAYRKLSVTEGGPSPQKPDESLITRLEHQLTAFRGALRSGTFYETGSGLEVKKEFSYVEVPAGQGSYAWTDYNGNGIRELNEFEVAAFPDQAKYIRVFTPTTDYVKAYSSQFSQSLTLNPGVNWRNEKGWKKPAGRFSNQAAYRIQRKTTDENTLNPFFSDVSDSSLLTVNSSFQNTFSFNRNRGKIGADIHHQDMRNKSLLVNGFDSRQLSEQGARLRWTASRQVTVEAEYTEGRRSSTSEFLTGRNFRIGYREAEPSLTFQPNNAFRIVLQYANQVKDNAADLGGEHAEKNSLAAEVRYSVLSKGSMMAQVSYIDFSYSGNENTATGFEMLEGLQNGRNITWSLSWQRNLSSNLQLSLSYDGRKPEGLKAIHTGNAQLRAYF